MSDLCSGDVPAWKKLNPKPELILAQQDAVHSFTADSSRYEMFLLMLGLAQPEKICTQPFACMLLSCHHRELA